MNIYTLFPLIATVAYIPLLITTISSRPWQRRHRLFVLFLISAMMWSLTDVFLRSNVFPEHSLLLLKLLLVMITWMGVQFHCFTTSFFAPGEGRWLPFAYASLAVVIALVALGYVGDAVVPANGDRLYLDYGRGVIFIAIPLLTFVARNLYLFGKRLKTLDNPVLYNQVLSLMLGISVLSLFILGAVLPWGREFPVSHFGNLINALILSYAVIRHELVDIRVVLRRGLEWVSLGIIGIGSYVMLLISLHIVFHFELSLTATFIATLLAIVVALFVYKLRDYLFITVSKAFLGRSYDYRQKLTGFANKKIHHVFSLREQGSELLELVTKAVGSKWASLLFVEIGSQHFTTQFVEPQGPDNPLSGLRLTGTNPIVEYLEREQKLLTRENLTILAEFRSLWESEKGEITAKEIDLFVPLVSRDRLIGILVLGKKESGKYSLEDLNLLEEITSRVAVSIEKEYLREQLHEREEELSIINRSSAIMTSSLDIQGIYGSFIEELKKVVDVGWAAIVLIEPNDLYFVALSSEIGSAWQVGERVPIRGSATEWVAKHRKALVEPDLAQECRFTTGSYHLQQGVRSIVYLPLLAKGRVIGSLIVASCRPNAYNPRQVALLEQLASQIAMPVENSQLYAEAEERARTDEVTGLLNRRALGELIASEVNRHSRYGGIFSLIILDLDSFKVFNDKYGHLAGDRVLQQIGSIMKKAIRSADQAFRYGGDEFAVLLPHTGGEAALEVAERLRHRVASAVGTGDVPITVSLGLATWPIDAVVADGIIAAADDALYHAKRSGGNQTQRALVALSSPAEGRGDGTRAESDGALSTIYSLAATVDSREHHSRNHSKRVSEYAVALAEALNLKPKVISRLETCALLHDVGKIGVSDEILNKWDKLTEEEWIAVKTHPEIGAAIVSHALQLTPCIEAVLYHHERYDGSGYPEGLKGENIPLPARILGVADAFVAMTSPRPYSRALSNEEAAEEIKRGAGKQFDPELVEVFLGIIQERVGATKGEEVSR
ncbi:MAG TPA: diguanylate cyclase [Dehalococcoidales bacterium]|nr:diguanylate cyclase [Dehalococcoidales bacterium]